MNGNGAKPAPVVLAVSDLVVSYRRSRSQAPVVQGASFAVRRGETHALLGQSGSGKSTIAKAILGLVPAGEGTVLYRDEPLDRLPRRRRLKLLREIQMVPQDPYDSLDPRMRIGASVAEALDRGRHGSTAARAAEVRRLLGTVSLAPELAERYPRELSGGQRQRVAIARALAAEPTVLIADEITSALDVSTQAEILELLKRLQRELDLTILFISHDLAVVYEISTEVTILFRGRVVEQGAASEVLRRPLHPYSKLLATSVPAVDRRVEMPRATMPESDVGARAADGCWYRPFCPFGPRFRPARKDCFEVAPDLRDLAGRRCACHHVEEDAGVSPVAEEPR